jgi:hypothetical protein
MTEGGDSLAPVVESSDVVFKVTGYDNVGVEELELRGVRSVAGGFALTGNPADVLSGATFAPQTVPGGLNGFSALRIVKVPAFSNAQGIEHDRYPIEVTATDRAGNESTARIVVAVGGDRAPEVVTVSSDRSEYLVRDTIRLTAQATDDLGVAQISVQWFLDGGATAVRSVTRRSSPSI